MKIVRFLGGLGNQMFQYAFYKSLEYQNIKVYADLSHFGNYDKHNGYELSRIFGIRLKHAPNLFLELLKPQQEKWIYRKARRVLGLRKSYQEEKIEFSYDPNVYSKGNNYLWGYWQNESYFNNIRVNLLHDFNFPKPEDKRNESVLKDIMDSVSVSLHVRRGDYLKDQNLGEICTSEYYNLAITYIKNKVTAPKFYIFSDDITWCKNHLSDEENMIFVDWNTGMDSYNDMYLMSNCKHNIIANSSFSWWGAWLNSNPTKIVISPSQWIKNSELTLSLNDWIKL
ncbi:MAG: alpha-1,2-fucosyltransferase [Pedobacter sp.]|uniref:alpha-1,2-fucosyltransferase n=1 Tax=Pedobacter sp. TaxID=1411316 RepID=UPI002808BA4E|nr:alpha-1,2-fucosyltransferase [Pedobacter sp.]MDQ8004975.1 alpha-1,2-fucosyltransferase [Pedobacter sp.]